MRYIDLDVFRSTSLVREPFEHAIVPRFIKSDSIASVLADFPRIEQGGSFPLSSLKFGPSFQQLCSELQGSSMTEAFAAKFEMDLSERPTTLTVRGLCRAKDGKIHTDSRSKLITVLIYMNGPWETNGGRLRLLRSGDNLSEYFAEVPPEQGTLLCFRNRENAWHGHTSFAGPRRAVQLNWVADEAAVRKSERRHGLSSLVKRLNPFVE